MWTGWTKRMETRNEDAWKGHIDKTCQRVKRHFFLETRRIIVASQVRTKTSHMMSSQQYNDCAKLRTSKLDDFIFAGGFMERTVRHVSPEIVTQIQEVRQMRMTIISEIQQSIAAMKDMGCEK